MLSKTLEMLLLSFKSSLALALCVVVCSCELKDNIISISPDAQLPSEGTPEQEEAPGTPPPPPGNVPPPIDLNWSMNFSAASLSEAKINGSNQLELDPYASRILTSNQLSLTGLVGQWELNGTIGSLINAHAFVDSTGNFGATLNDGGNGSASLSAFDFDETLNFDGVDDFVALPDNNSMIKNVSAISIMMWVKFPDVTPIAGWEHLISLSTNVSATSSRIEIRTQRDTIEIMSRSQDAEAPHLFTFAGPSFETGIWMHVAEVTDYASNTMKLYLNGVEVITATPSFSQVNTDDTVSLKGALGAEDDGSDEFFTGSMSHVSLWSRALTIEEIQKAVNYQALKVKQGEVISAPLMLEPHLTSLQFSWLTTAPFMRPLPKNNLNETGYTEGNFTMTYGATDNLLYLDFDDNSFTNLAMDQSGGNLNASCVGIKCPMQVPGKIGMGMEFDGIDDVLEISGFTPSPQGSLVFWAQIPYVANIGRIIGGNDDFEVKVDDGIMSNDFYVDGSDFVTSPIRVNSFSWQLFGLTWDFGGTGDTKIYLDGSLIANGAKAVNDPGGPFTLSIGTRTGSSSYFKGRLDEILIFNRVLTDAEMLNIFHRQDSQVKIQLRTCLDLACSGNPPFAGVGGDSSLSYSPIGLGFEINPSFNIDEFLQPNQFLQFRIQMTTDGRNFSSPKLVHLQVLGQ